MGSISRTSRCDRFRKQLEDKVSATSPFKMGDWVEVVGVCVGMEDSSEVSKLLVTFRNKRTGDEDTLSFDGCLFDPEGMDEDNVDRLHYQLFNDQGYEETKERKKHRNEAIKLLKGAELISKDYKEKR
jgi:hypothetical protein